MRPLTGCGLDRATALAPDSFEPGSRQGVEGAGLRRHNCDGSQDRSDLPNGAVGHTAGDFNGETVADAIITTSQGLAICRVVLRQPWRRGPTQLTKVTAIAQHLFQQRSQSARSAYVVSLIIAVVSLRRLLPCDESVNCPVCDDDTREPCSDMGVLSLARRGVVACVLAKSGQSGGA